MDCYKVLGIEPTKDIRLIKRAYAKLLPNNNPEKDPEAFKTLRAAYEEALAKSGEDKSSDNTVSTVDEFMKKFEELYNDFEKRIDTGLWKALLESDVCYNIDTGTEVSFRILRFIMDHYYFPSEVWALFNKYFSWSTKKERLSIKFPKNFIEFVVNKINYPGYFDYKSLLLCRENRQEEFMDQYSRASGALDDYNLYDTVKSIGVCREICPGHPDLQILEARYLMANGSMDEADTILHSLIEKDNRNVFAYVFRGHLFYRLGKYAEACDEYKKALELYPDSGEILAPLGKCCTSLKKYEEAIKYLNRLNEISQYNNNARTLLVSAQNFWLDSLLNMLKEKPDDQELQYKLADIYYSTGKIEEAYGLLSNLEQNNLLNAEKYYLLCNVLVYMDKSELAYTTCCKALSFFPQDARLYGVKALILDELGNYTESVKTYETAIELNPNDSLYYNNMSYSLNRLKRFNEALESANKAIMLNPQMANAYKNKAEALLGLQLYEECFEACEEALNYYLYLTDAYVIKMKLFSRVRQYEEALAVYSRAADLGLSGSKLIYEKANVFCQTGRYDEAIDLCNQALEADPKNYDPYFCKGLCHFNRENYQEALDCLDNAIQHGSVSEDVYYYKALSLLNISRINEALAVIDKAIGMNTTFRDRFHDLKGEVLFNQKRFDEALSEYKKAIEKNPGFAPYYYSAGKCINNMKNHQEAIKYFDLTIEKDPSMLEAYIDKSHALYHLSLFKECAAECDTVLKADPNYILAYQNKAWAMFRAGNIAEAENNCNLGLKIDGNHINLLHLKLDIFREKKMIKEALAVADRILELDPEDEYNHSVKEELLKLSKSKSGLLGKLFG